MHKIRVACECWAANSDEICGGEDSAQENLLNKIIEETIKFEEHISYKNKFQEILEFTEVSRDYVLKKQDNEYILRVFSSDNGYYGNVFKNDSEVHTIDHSKYLDDIISTGLSWVSKNSTKSSSSPKRKEKTEVMDSIGSSEHSKLNICDRG